MINRLFNARSSARCRLRALRRVRCTMIGILALAAWEPATAAAGAAPAANAPLAAADVRIIVDISSGMEQVDPQNQRSRALALLLRLLPDDGRAGVWTYGQYVNVLVKYGVSNDLWKETASMLTRNLASAGTRSSLREAIDRASWDRSASNRPAHLVLLTDGRLAVSDDAAVNAAERTRLLEELAPELATAGYRVHTLALSEHADTVLLGQLAALTGGYHGRIETPEALPEDLVTLLGWLTSAATVDVSEQGTFRIAPGTREVTLLKLGNGFDSALTLMNPGGERLDATTPRERVRWHLDQRYQMITLEHPAPGVWRFDGVERNGVERNVRVFAYGDLSIGYPDMPATVFPGELQSYDLALTGRGGAVVDRAFLDLLTVSARLSGPEGDVPLVVEPADGGRFRVNLQGLRGRGDYVLETRVQAPTFTHHLSLPFVLDNPLSIEVHPAEEGFVLWARVGAWEVDHDSLRIAAMVKHPPAAAKLFPVERLPGGLWKLTVPGHRGLIEVVLDIEGKYLNDKDFELRTQPLRVVLPVARVQYADMDLEGRPLLAATLPRGQEPVTRPVPETPPPADPAVASEPAPAPPAATVPPLIVWLAAAASIALCLLLWWLLGPRRSAADLTQAMARLRAVAEVYDAPA